MSNIDEIIERFRKSLEESIKRKGRLHWFFEVSYKNKMECSSPTSDKFKGVSHGI